MELYLLGILLFFLAFTSKSNSMQVQVRGSMNLGNDVLETIKYFLVSPNENGRRTLQGPGNDVLKSPEYCKDLKFCGGPLQKFLQDYITTLANILKSIFQAAHFQSGKAKDVKENKDEFITESDIASFNKKMKRALTKANTKINEDNEDYVWATVIKKISSKLQSIALNNVQKRLTDEVGDIEKSRKRISQKIVVAVAVTEATFEKKLCTAHSICMKVLPCTTALNAVLEQMELMPYEKASLFINYVQEAIQTVNFYSKLDDVTAAQLKSILNDMSFNKNVSNEEVISTLHGVVESRLNSFRFDSNKNNDPKLKGQDVHLINAILSDMDYVFYNVNDPFDVFLERLILWVKLDKKLKQTVLKIVESIGAEVDTNSIDMTAKLTQAVRVFLEITIDPE